MSVLSILKTHEFTGGFYLIIHEYKLFLHFKKLQLVIRKQMLLMNIALSCDFLYKYYQIETIPFVGIYNVCPSTIVVNFKALGILFHI